MLGVELCGVGPDQQSKSCAGLAHSHSHTGPADATTQAWASIVGPLTMYTERIVLPLDLCIIKPTHDDNQHRLQHIYTTSRHSKSAKANGRCVAQGLMPRAIVGYAKVYEICAMMPTCACRHFDNGLAPGHSCMTIDNCTANCCFHRHLRLQTELRLA